MDSRLSPTNERPPVARRPDTPCASCGRLLYVGRGSLPNPVCQPCRRLRRKVYGSCAECDGPITTRSGNQFCSVACANRHHALPRPACVICGAIFRKSYSEQRTCGRACGVELKRRSRPVGPVVFPQRRLAWHQCRECNQWIGQPNRLVCRRDLCLRSARSRSSAKARARRREQIADAAGFSHLAIFQRDRWVCGICNSTVDPRHQWPHPKAPSLDHIVPLSKGGTHTPENVQLAHIGCNWKKNNRGGGEQLRLVG